MRTLDVPTRTRTTQKVSVRHPEQQQLFDPDPLIDKEGAARCLGVEQRFINRLVSEKRIAYVKVGRKIRFRQSTIEAYIIANTVSAQSSRPSSRH
jgi:excisionase family DNA binding protein